MNACKRNAVASALVLFLVSSFTYAADFPTKFTNMGSISNTRHNLTQQPAAGGINYQAMDAARNNYGEVCVYCHTPHGANTAVALPLWNRTIKATTYNTYDKLGTTTLTQTVSQPGAASLSCLSCHDGQTAIDSIVNMPGSGRYDAASMTSQNDTFLNTWTNASGVTTVAHATLSLSANPSCVAACHNPSGLGATDFSIFAIGTDLRNDHPVGVTFPTTNGNGTDFKTPSGLNGATKYFDIDENGKMGSGDVRLYNTDGKPQVECASCHDPHGVPSAGPGSKFNPTFLRVSNSSSALCLTCHSK